MFSFLWGRINSQLSIKLIILTLSSDQFSRSVMSDSLQPHGLQYARLPCPSPTPRAYANLCPLSQWCHPTISSSVVSFSSRLQSFPTSGSFPMSQFFSAGGQNIGVSASASVLPMNIQDWFPLGWTGWVSLLSKVLSRVFSSPTVQKHQFFSAQLSLTLEEAFPALFNLNYLNFYWHIVNLQYHVSFRYIVQWFNMCIYVYIYTHTHIYRSLLVIYFIHQSVLLVNQAPLLWVCCHCLVEEFVPTGWC